MVKDREVCHAAVHGVAKSRTGLSDRATVTNVMLTLRWWFGYTTDSDRFIYFSPKIRVIKHILFTLVGSFSNTHPTYFYSQTAHYHIF